jgi:hypothetical protein
MKKWHREPLLHFLIIGTAIFAVFSIANKEEVADSGNKIVVSSAEIKRLSDSWSPILKRKSTTAKRCHWVSIRMIPSSGAG